MLNNDCCLVNNIYLNSERISSLLQSRFKRNSNRTSFDFKSCFIEQILNNIKFPRSSSFETYPRIIKTSENILSESSDEEIEQISSPNLTTDVMDDDNNDDDYLDKLARWEPNKLSTIETDEDDEEEEEAEKMEDHIHIDSVYSPAGRSIRYKNNQKQKQKHLFVSIEMSSTEIEDLFITYVQDPVKTEPVINVNIPQLDGQNDFLQNKTKTKRLTNNQNKKKKISTQYITAIELEKAIWENAFIDEEKYTQTYPKVIYLKYIIQIK